MVRTAKYAKYAKKMQDAKGCILGSVGERRREPPSGAKAVFVCEP